MDKHQHTVKMFSEHVGEYVSRFMDLGLYRDTFDAFALMLPVNARVLELGCGPGNVVKYLLSLRPDLEMVGIDLAPGMIEEARKQNPGVRFELMDIREVSRIEHRFDAVIAAFCLPYMAYEDVPGLFENVSRLISAGGLVYVSFMEGAKERSGFEKTSFTGEAELYINYYSSLEIEELMRRNGFEVRASFSKDYEEMDGSVTKDVVLVGGMPY